MLGTTIPGYLRSVVQSAVRCERGNEVMSVSIELPCGCRINEAFVLGMCPQHVLELAQKTRENDIAMEWFDRQIRSAEGKPADGSK